MEPPDRERLVVIEQPFAHGEQVAMVTRNRDERGEADGRVIGRHRIAVGLQERAEPVPQRGLGQPTFQAGAFRRIRGDVPQVPLLLQPGEELELAELHRLEPRRRRQQRSEGQEVLRRHRLQHLDVLDQHALDRVDADQVVPRALGIAREHALADRLQLEQQLLEPQLIGLVDDDEQQLVVHRGVRAELLHRQQLRDLQVRAVRQEIGGRLRQLPEPPFAAHSLTVAHVRHRRCRLREASNDRC